MKLIQIVEIYFCNLFNTNLSNFYGHFTLLLIKLYCYFDYYQLYFHLFGEFLKNISEHDSYVVCQTHLTSLKFFFVI